MKKYGKIALLVALALVLLVTACTRQASTKAPAGQTTPTGEAPFPFTTPGQGGGIADFGTQTAVAKTPQVVIATNTPPGGEVIQPVATEQPGTGGGQEGGAETGGGVEPTQAPPAAAINTPVVERPASYTISKGEHPYCIARRFDLDIATLLNTNGLNNASKVSVGTTLRIPASGNWSISSYGNRSLKAHPASYTVQAGDTVNSIACQFGDVTPEGILAVNGLANASDVKTGMTLQIP
jgi:LysM repeat protein